MLIDVLSRREGCAIPRRYNEPGHLTQEVAAFQKALGQRLRELRKKHDLSIRDMTVLHGYADAQYRKMEREGVGSTHSLIRLAKIFQISVADLLTGIEQTEPELATWNQSSTAMKLHDPAPSEPQDIQTRPLNSGRKLLRE